MYLKKAIITGIWGQDASYLFELLSSNEIIVHGIERTPLSENSKKIRAQIKSFHPSLKVHNINLMCFTETKHLIEKIRPDYIFHLAATHFSSQSEFHEIFKFNDIIFKENVIPSLNLLRSICELKIDTRFVFAGSCLMFDGSSISPQDEKTPWISNSAYGLSKITVANWIKFYREKYNLKASTAILYNHESPRRSIEFVTQKIVTSLVNIKRGKQQKLFLRNVDSIKDWSHSKDIVRALLLMAENEDPEDFIVSSGKGRSIHDLIVNVSKKIKLKDWEKYVSIDSSPTYNNSITKLIGNPNYLINKLNWKPNYTFQSLINDMVKYVN